MPRSRSSLELPLPARDSAVPAGAWLYDALRAAILSGRLAPGARVPASRDLAAQYGMARGTVVAVFEQLRAEGYLDTRVGAGTWVSATLPDELAPASKRAAPRAVPVDAGGPPVRPFRPYEPAVEEFPVRVWARLAARRWQRVTRAELRGGHLAGYWPLRVAVADYLGASRGVRCAPEQVIIMSGTQQALDVVARIVARDGASAWVEDPGYHAAVSALRNAGARVVPVPVDDAGLDVAAGRARAPDARLACVTPAHQFPLGVVMSGERRRALLAWAETAGAYLIEDDYDSEYRFSGAPVRSLQAEDASGRVVFLGSFNKVLFSSLRLGYAVVPPSLLDAVLRMRYDSDRWVTTVNQAVLADFITDGHLGRHLRRTREVYAERLQALRAAADTHADGLLRLPAIDAGVAIPAFCGPRIDPTAVEVAAAAEGLETLTLGRFCLESRVRGFLLGFAAFEPRALHAAMRRFAGLLRATTGPPETP